MHVPKSRHSEMALCKNGIGHAWDQIPSTRRPPFGEYIWLRCTRCGTQREDIVQPWTGKLLSRKYYHPDGYKQVDKETRAEWRARAIAPKARRRAREGAA